MIRRQLILFDGYSTDYRVGAGALGDLARLFKGLVTRPKRAVMVLDGSVSASLRERVEVDLAASDFAVTVSDLSAADDIATIEQAADLQRSFAAVGLTADDAVVAVGGREVAAVVMFAARTWCGGTAVAIVPTTLDAMATVATTMRGLDAGEVQEAVSVPAHAALVVCDTDLVCSVPADERALGLVCMTGSILTESRRAWDRYLELVSGLVAGDAEDTLSALAATQTARAAVLKAANPSARAALGFGCTTSRALANLLGDALTPAQYLTEGIRFESRLAHDALDFPVDDVFALDDALFDLGFDEPAFELDAQSLADAIRSERFSNSNRFMLPLPHTVGSLRLATVEDDVLLAHARAYLDARAER